jgi:hypothetical protein
MNPLPAYRIHLNDGTSYVTSMAIGISLADATAYFLSQVQTDEDDLGHESTRTVINITIA